MNEMIRVPISADVHARLQALMVPPLSDLNAVIASLLEYEGHATPAVIALKADEQHFSFAEELERASQGVYECGGAT